MQENEILDAINLGRVWHGGRFWRKGITTGTCAAAAAKAGARLLISGEQVANIVVKLTHGQKIKVPLQSLVLEGSVAKGTVIKDGGDDPDVTTGLEIVAKVQLKAGGGIEILGGQGVGRATKPGLQVAPGQPAINPSPRKMIEENIREVLGPVKGAVVEITVPGGEQAALKTMNSQLGIEGGISIIGTNGIVEPMSEEAFKESLLGRVSLVKAQGYRTLILTPGRRGEKQAVERYGLPEELVVQMSNFIGYMLEQAVKEKFRRILLLGHIGKMVKLAAGIFHTHNRIADGRLEVMAAWLGILGAPSTLLQAVLEQATTEAAVALVREHGYGSLFLLLAEKAEDRCQKFLKGEVVQLGVVLTDLEGSPLGISTGADEIGRELGWQIR